MRLICGVGFNDSPYNVNWTEDGKVKRCPIYACWKDMLLRTNQKTNQKTRLISYTDCTVHPDWLYFSKFLSWAKPRFRDGYQLDKDLLVQGNKVYSPETCVFLPRALNCLFRKSSRVGESGVLGVRPKLLSSGKVRYEAHTKGPLGYKYLGFHSSIEEAHLCWQKHRVLVLEDCIKQYPEIEPKAIAAIRERIVLLQDDINNRRITRMV